MMGIDPHGSPSPVPRSNFLNCFSRYKYHRPKCNPYSQPVQSPISSNIVTPFPAHCVRSMAAPEAFVVGFFDGNTTHAELVAFVDEHKTTKGVRVEMVGPIQRLCDLVPARNLLVQQHRRHKWWISGRHQLNALARIARLVRVASVDLNTVYPFLADTPQHIRFIAIQEAATDLMADGMLIDQEVQHLEENRFQFAAVVRDSRISLDLLRLGSHLYDAVRRFPEPGLNYVFAPLGWPDLRRELSAVKSRVNNVYTNREVSLATLPA